MDRAEILDSIQTLMADVFDLDDLAISDATSADDIEEWDSLSHIRFMVSVERHFKIKLRNEEIAELKSVGDLVSAIAGKIA